MNGLETTQSAETCTSMEASYDDSLLNKNVSASKIEISDLLSTSEVDMEICEPKLSFSLSTKEIENLKHWKTKNTRTKQKTHGTTDLTLDVDNESEAIVDLTQEETEARKTTETIEIDDECTLTKQPSQNQDLEKKEIVGASSSASAEQTAKESITMVDEEIIQFEGEGYYFQNDIIEVGRRLWCSDATAQHYTKGCLWSPDGTCLLVPVHLDGMHIIELPLDLYDSPDEIARRPPSSLPSAVHVKEGGTIYDCAWFPYMNSNEPNTCIWLATRQHEPIHMWDAFTGELRCSYRGYDDVDEVEAAISIQFTQDGQKILGGYKKNIKIFDTNIPGRNYNTIKVKQAVSCLAKTSDSNDTITTGSWKGYINHYDMRAPKLGSLFTLGGHSGGITWLRYVPSSDNWFLFSGARKDNKILQWDMRNYVAPVFEFNREVSTNQRIYFDFSPQMRWLASGGTDGLLRLWDLNDEIGKIELALHKDCCNGVNFHPSLPVLATSSGQYHFINITDDVQNEENVQQIVDYENALLFVWFGKCSKYS